MVGPIAYAEWKPKYHVLCVISIARSTSPGWTRWSPAKVFRRGLWATPRPAPGSRRACSVFGSAMISGRPTTIFGDGSATRDYVYVDDVVIAFLCAAVSGYRNRRLRTGHP